MNDPDFRDLVRRMRAAQREYFRARDRGMLEAARQLEIEVDTFLENASERQGGLFADTEPRP